MMKGVIVQSRTTVVVIALLVVLTALIVIVMTIDPFTSQATLAARMANSLAMDIDTMSTVEKGRVEITIDPSVDYFIKTVYHKKGRKEGYEIFSDGWYVVVSIARGTRVYYGIGRIYTYPSVYRDDMKALETEMWKPQKVCIIKSKDNQYPRVKEWLLGC